MPAIVLATLNGRYAHASLGLRYLRANLGVYREQSILHEVTIKHEPLKVAEEILAFEPRLVGLGVYIWNTVPTLAVVRHLKRLKPELLVVVGGPEISYETEGQELFATADYVFQGEADFTFRDFVANWMETGQLPVHKIIAPLLPELKQTVFPYDEYTDEDIRQRTLYVEASRGCPYKCEYCLSALDISVRNFDGEAFLGEMQKLLDRGARQFKFVDRTFNLAPKISSRILRFFLERVELGLFLHFEMVPDRLPEELKSLIRLFPPGALQFEIGIQTWNPEVARNVSRRQNYANIVENLRFLHEHTGVHTHADLIVGLPGETWESFAVGFNALYALAPDEIQVGVLKRLKGTPIVRHDAKFAMKYATTPPFQIIENKDLTAEQILRLKIFADFWNALVNSGRFPGLKVLATETGIAPFDFFYDLSVWLHQAFGRTHSIHLKDLESQVRAYLNQKNWCEDRGATRVQKRGGGAAEITLAIPQRQRAHLLSTELASPSHCK